MLLFESVIMSDYNTEYFSDTGILGKQFCFVNTKLLVRRAPVNDNGRHRVRRGPGRRRRVTVPAGPFACRRVVRQGAGRFGSSRVLPLTGVDRP